MTCAIYRELDPFSANESHIVKERGPRKPMAVLEVQLFRVLRRSPLDGLVTNAIYYGLVPSESTRVVEVEHRDKLVVVRAINVATLESKV